MKYKNTGLEEGPQGFGFSPLQEQDTKKSSEKVPRLILTPRSTVIMSHLGLWYVSKCLKCMTEREQKRLRESPMSLHSSDTRELNKQLFLEIMEERKGT